MSDIKLLIAKGDTDVYLLPQMANRHGLITGATGTGKTVSLQVLAENFSSLGTPVFLSDIKGDLSGLGSAGGGNPKIEDRIKTLGFDSFDYHSYPVQFWDVFGEQGIPVRTTVSEMGPLLLSRLLNLNDVQSGVLNLVFKIADDQGLLLLDLKDLRAMLTFVGEHAAEYTVEYGTISKQSVGAIQRALLVIEEQGGDKFFAEPALNILDFMKTDANGFGYMNILSCDKLFQSPDLYSTFLLWLLSELYENLPEVGDLDRPKMVFFFDEAHLLFDEAPKILLDRVEQVVRLIRSKGVGVYFVTQNPVDIPDRVAGQLGNRIQHALRAYTPKDQKAIRAAAETFRQNPNFSVETIITELAVGEALVSLLDEKGRPSVVERAFLLPPHSHVGPLSADKRQEEIYKSPLRPKYEQMVDRQSAYEFLQAKYDQGEADQATAEKVSRKRSAQEEQTDSESPRKRRPGRPRDTFAEKVTKSAASSVGRTVARELVRGLLGSFLRK